jgi:methylthioribose-1-phosphate isomerase
MTPDTTLPTAGTTEESRAKFASDFSPLRWSDEAIEILDQTLLPREEVWLRCTRPEDVADAIRRLSIRGAPAIGVAAAYGLVVAVQQGGAAAFSDAYELLLSTRPTAVNLRWALEQGQQLRDATPDADLEPALLRWAQRLHREDAAINRAIGEHSVHLFASGDRVLTHCNAGALATAGYGTAVGVIRSAWAAGALAAVWVDETRPLLQGARLTAWELQQLEIPFRIVTDNSVGALMSRGHVDKVVVGADRIAANGDVANKIGTYTVAVLAQRHGVPFYVAAPRSTIDPRTPTGGDIPIEERDALEVTEVFGTRVAPTDAGALNIAFDVTPAELVAGIITEVGVLEAPYGEAIARALAQP